MNIVISFREVSLCLIDHVKCLCYEISSIMHAADST
jgi:hypothetical protein